MGEEVTIKSLSEKLGISPKEIKETLELVMTTPGATALTPEQVALFTILDKTDAVEKVVAVAKKVAKVAAEIIFFWGEGRNQQFIVPSGEKDVKGVNYKSTNSVLKLDVERDADAIKYLRAHKKNEANGGAKFTEMDSLSVAESEQGNVMDRLMKLDQKVLAEMAGGGIDNQRKSVGTLIMELMAND